MNKTLGIIGMLFLVAACGNDSKNVYRDNSPTSGKLRVYYDEGLELHVKNQVFTFESQYSNAEIETVLSTDAGAVQALYNDSCEAIVISRLLTASEAKAFASKQYFPDHSRVAYSGVAVLTSQGTALRSLSRGQIKTLIGGDGMLSDSSGTSVKLKVIFDRNNSSVMHYMADSVLGGKLSENCSALNSTREALDYVAQTKNTVAIVDFAWLSDIDDERSKSYLQKLRYVPLISDKTGRAEYPSQSSFKLGTYPFTRSVYVMRKVGDFTLAKGFESFVAGPKGQLTFLKQGLMPARQAERVIEVNMEGNAE